MTTLPLILQIQAAALDSKTSVAETLRMAKVACKKLCLDDFAGWVDLELNGYMGKSNQELPEYRVLHGTPQGHNPIRGWQPIIFEDSWAKTQLSTAPVAMSIPAIENLLQSLKANEVFAFPYPTEVANEIRKTSEFTS